jgi:S1-C subfamily serine protease
MGEDRTPSRKEYLMRTCVLLVLLVAVACPQPTPADVLDPVVRIMVANGTGSGVCIASFGEAGSLIVTNWHIVNAGAPFVVEKFYRRGNAEGWSSHPAELLYSDEAADLAILWTPARVPAAPLLVGSSRLLEPTWLVGFPAAREAWVTPGVLTSKDAQLKSYQGARLLASSSPIWYGCSGGALFVHRQGAWYLAGIPARIWVDWGKPVPHMGYSVPVEAVRAFLRRWVLDMVWG